MNRFRLLVSFHLGLGDVLARSVNARRTLSELLVSESKGGLAPNESSMRYENDSLTLRSTTIFAIGLVPAITDHVTCPDVHFVRHMPRDALGVRQIMETSKMHTGVHQFFSYSAALAGRV